MTESELLVKAHQAAYDYRAVYGKFPIQIGIELSQIGWLPPCFYCPDPPLRDALKMIEGKDILTTVPYTRHTVRFEPVLGPDIQKDEVYVSPPSSPFKVISGSLLTKLAKEFE